MTKRTARTVALVIAACLGLLAAACEPPPTKPTASIADARRAEGTGGTVHLAFAVTLSAPSAETVRLAWSTVDGTAKQPADYTASSGSVEFAPGATTANLFVPVVGDDVDEPNETFFVTLWPSTTADVADNTGAGVIEDDEAAPDIYLDDAPFGAETNTGSWAGFPIRLSRPSASEIRISCRTVNGTAEAGKDFPVQNPCVITVPAGATRVDHHIPRWEDNIDEADESYRLELTNAVGGVIQDSDGMTVIFDINPPPVFVMDDVDMPEGNPPNMSFAVFTGHLSHPSSRVVYVNCETRGNTAAQGDDYIGTFGNCFGFSPGTTTDTFDVAVRSDTRKESDEVFFVDITGLDSRSAPVHIGDTVARATLRNDGDSCILFCSKV